ncbi:hypothetical protein G8O24_43555, partial [Bradyrhizobium sp. INPA01-394B]|uniref:hypothetical protein n=1 Tax=Bradyrhizobium campsiandrae TaxID=1729892 RepID=UPI00165F9B31
GHHADLGIRRRRCRTDRVGIELHELTEAAGARLLVAEDIADALGKFLPDQDRPNEGVFSFQDDDEQWISLRYDLTAPLARYV